MSSTEDRLRGLMLAGLAGDQRAYRALLSDLSQSMRAYFGRRLGSSPAEVEDLVQETLLAVHTRRGTYDPGRPFTAWAYAIARYKLADRLRGRARREALHEELDESLFTVEAETEAADARRDLMTLLARLPEGQRTPILLTRIEGLSIEEAAARTGTSASAVKVSVHRGLKKLAALVISR